MNNKYSKTQTHLLELRMIDQKVTNDFSRFRLQSVWLKRENTLNMPTPPKKLLQQSFYSYFFFKDNNLRMIKKIKKNINEI